MPSACAARRVAQLAEGFGFDVADALAGDLEALADLFRRVLGVSQRPKHILVIRSREGSRYGDPPQHHLLG